MSTNSTNNPKKLPVYVYFALAILLVRLVSEQGRIPIESIGWVFLIAFAGYLFDLLVRHARGWFKNLVVILFSVVLVCFTLNAVGCILPGLPKWLSSILAPQQQQSGQNTRDKKSPSVGGNARRTQVDLLKTDVDFALSTTIPRLDSHPFKGDYSTNLVAIYQELSKLRTNVEGNSSRIKALLSELGKIQDEITQRK